MVSPYIKFAELLGKGVVHLGSAEAYVGPLPETDPPADPQAEARAFAELVAPVGAHENGSSGD